ncbi:MAG: AraC family transcriptional regulator [Bacteroidota bacterium]
MIKKQIKYKGRVIFEKVVVSRFTRAPKYYMDDEACVMFLDGGEFTTRSSSQILKINNKSALVSRCMNYYMEMSTSQEEISETVQAVGVMLYPSVIQEIFDITLLNPLINKTPSQKTYQVDPLLHAFKDSISHLIDHPELADEHIIVLKIRELIFLLMKREASDSIVDYFSNLFNPVVHEIEQTVKTNLYSNLSIDELAFLAHMSTSTFKRRFKKIYNLSPHKYITAKKIERACLLLSSTHYSISEISERCGFESISTFNRNFNNAMNRSPSVFRTELKSN